MSDIKLGYTFKPLDLVPELDIPAADKSDALKEVADYVLEQVLSTVGEAKSPVEGYGKFQKLSKDYAIKKKEISGSDKPNLELFGDMLSALESGVKGNSVSLFITGEEAEKADGHCQLTGRDSHLPLRRFIPAPDETFNRKIIDGVKEILTSYAKPSETTTETTNSGLKSVSDLLGDEDF